MTPERFFASSVAIFMVVGPLVPMGLAGIAKAATTGDLGNLGAPLVWAVPSYLLGAPFALLYGVSCSAAILGLTVLRPKIPALSLAIRVLFSLLVGTAVVFALNLSSLLSKLQDLRSYPNFTDLSPLETLQALWRIKSADLAVFAFPTWSCMFLVGWLLLPRLAFSLRDEA